MCDYLFLFAYLVRSYTCLPVHLQSLSPLHGLPAANLRYNLYQTRLTNLELGIVKDHQAHRGTKLFEAPNQESWSHVAQLELTVRAHPSPTSIPGAHRNPPISTPEYFGRWSRLIGLITPKTTCFRHVASRTRSRGC